MRLIKFRAWDKKNKKMWYPYKNTTMSFGELIDNFSDDVLMQFTGLLDKNGKEIYEGDIVGQKGFCFPVTWDRGCYHIGNSQTLIEWLDARSRRGLQTEIVGNIYENPELLSPHPTRKEEDEKEKMQMFMS